MTLEVVTQEGARVKALQIEEVTLPGVLGELGILPGHIAMIAGLGIGPMIARTSGGEVRYALSGGFVEVLGDEVRVLSETCERFDEIDVDRAREKLTGATIHLSQVAPSEEQAFEAALASVRKAETRLKVAGAGSPKH